MVAALAAPPALPGFSRPENAKVLVNMVSLKVYTLTLNWNIQIDCFTVLPQASDTPMFPSNLMVYIGRIYEPWEFELPQFATKSQLIYYGKSNFDGLSIALHRCLRPVSIQISDTGSDVRNESLHVSPNTWWAQTHSTAFNQQVLVRVQ